MLDDYKPHKGKTQYYIRLEDINNSSHACQYQIKNQITPVPKIKTNNPLLRLNLNEKKEATNSKSVAIAIDSESVEPSDSESIDVSSNNSITISDESVEPLLQKSHISELKDLLLKHFPNKIKNRKPR